MDYNHSGDEVVIGDRNTLCGLVSAILEFADRAYQKRVWIDGRGSEVTSYSEAMVAVLEDGRIKEFAAGRGSNFGLRADQLSALGEFGTVLEQFDGRLRDRDSGDSQIVTQSDWDEVVAAAEIVRLRCKDWASANCADHPDLK